MVADIGGIGVGCGAVVVVVDGIDGSRLSGWWWWVGMVFGGPTTTTTTTQQTHASDTQTATSHTTHNHQIAQHAMWNTTHIKNRRPKI